MPEQKYKIGKTSTNSQFKCNTNSQKHVVAIKPITKSIIIYKNQRKGSRQPAPGSYNIERIYCLFEKNNSVWYLFFKYRMQMQYQTFNLDKNLSKWLKIQNFPSIPRFPLELWKQTENAELTYNLKKVDSGQKNMFRVTSFTIKIGYEII